MNQAGFKIIPCPKCGAKNRVPSNKRDPDKPDTAGRPAKCGKCGSLLQTDTRHEQWLDNYTIRCTSCRAKNRIPASKINDMAKCGKCKSVLETKELFNGHPVMVTDRDFDGKVLNSPLPVLLYCWSAGCPTCQLTGPVVDQFAAESKGRVRVAKINVANSPAVASRYNILGVPFLLIFDNGQLKESLPGSIPKHEIMMKMARYI
jgi:thioredoxin 2